MKHLQEIEQNYSKKVRTKMSFCARTQKIKQHENWKVIFWKRGKQRKQSYRREAVWDDILNARFRAITVTKRKRGKTHASRAAESRSAKCRKQIDVFGNVCCMYKSSVNVWVDGNCKQFEHTQKTRQNKKLKKATTKK